MVVDIRLVSLVLLTALNSPFLVSDKWNTASEKIKLRNVGRRTWLPAELIFVIYLALPYYTLNI